MVDELTPTRLDMRINVPEITLENVTHWFTGTAQLFDPVTFTGSAGEVTAICGPSGCGKSTLLAIAAGQLVPRCGSVRYTHVTSTIWVFQNPHGVANRSALDHVSFPLICRGLPRRQAEDEALRILDDFNLMNTACRPFGSLSGGEAQRLMLARAIACRPDLLLIDEPTAQLDATATRSVNSLIATTAHSGAIVLVASHDPAVKDQCSQVVDLGAGRAEESTETENEVSE